MRTRVMLIGNWGDFVGVPCVTVGLYAGKFVAPLGFLVGELLGDFDGEIVATLGESVGIPGVTVGLYDGGGVGGRVGSGVCRGVGDIEGKGVRPRTGNWVRGNVTLTGSFVGLPSDAVGLYVGYPVSPLGFLVGELTGDVNGATVTMLGFFVGLPSIIVGLYVGALISSTGDLLGVVVGSLGLLLGEDVRDRVVFMGDLLGSFVGDVDGSFVGSSVALWAPASKNCSRNRLDMLVC